MESFGWNVYLDSLPTVYDGDIQNVIGYIQWGAGPMDSYELPNNWSVNGISAALAFNTAETFDNTESIYTEKTVSGHMIEKNYAIGNIGYVDFVKLNNTDPNYKFKAYFDPTNNYNLAESYPVKDVIYFKNKIGEVTIFDASDKVLRKNIAENNSIKVSDLEKGIYMLQFELEEKMIMNKIVKK